MYDVADKVVKHKAFWEKAPVERPLMGFRIGDYLFANKFQAALPLLQEGKKILPDMLNVDRFLDDYERMYSEIQQIGQDAFWAASPFTATPWMEAILGCEVRASQTTMLAKPRLNNLNAIDQIVFNEDNNPWFAKYVEFVEKLTQHSQGRYPVGQPIMRGISDMMGALRGQSNLMLDLVDHPKKIQQLGQKLAGIFRRVIRKHRESTNPFQGGYSIGFYHLWCPGPCICFQEDLSALISPTMYRTYIYDLNIKMCEGYDYAMCHIHSESFAILNDLLQIEALKAIEINKDVRGPSISEMLPAFKRVLQKKRLVIWGNLDQKDLEVLLSELPYDGLYLHSIAPTVEDAKHLMEYTKKRCQRTRETRTATQKNYHGIFKY